MVKDSTYYNTLELETNATQSEIRKAYKRLVKENPPNSDDTEVFTKVSEAFFVLSDPERRKEYDETGIAELDYDPDKLYQDVFLNGSEDDSEEDEIPIENRRFVIPPVRVAVSLSLDESYFGAHRKIVYKRMVPNPDVSYEDGKIPNPELLLPQESDIEFDIPVGAKPGESLTFDGLGHNVPNYGRTDLVLVFVDEDEYEEEEGSFHSRTVSSCTNEDSDESWETEEEVEAEEEEPEEEEEEDGRKYEFERGEDNNLEMSMNINLKEYYYGVERAIKYFGNQLLYFSYYGKIDCDKVYVIPGYGINGADFRIRFDLELPDEIPDKNKKDFVKLMDKICEKYNDVDFSKIDKNSVHTLVPQDDDESDEEDDNENNPNPVQCAHQ